MMVNRCRYIYIFIDVRMIGQVLLQGRIVYTDIVDVITRYVWMLYNLRSNLL